MEEFDGIGQQIMGLMGTLWCLSLRHRHLTTIICHLFALQATKLSLSSLSMIITTSW